MAVCRSPALAHRSCQSGDSDRMVKPNCLAFGSQNVDSDIDVTVSSTCFVTNYLVTLSIDQFMTKCFEKDIDVLFQGNLKNVYAFFDINFYITNFAIRTNGDSDVTSNLSDYCISNQFRMSLKLNSDLHRLQEGGQVGSERDVHIHGQYDYAFHEWVVNHKKIIAEPQIEADYVYGLMVEVQEITTKIQKVNSRHLDNNDIQTDINRAIGIMSSVSMNQVESYHCQGTFFHVVMCMQRNLGFPGTVTYLQKTNWQNMLMCSLIENMCYAHIHSLRSLKYLTRVMDALKRLQYSLGEPPIALLTIMTSNKIINPTSGGLRVNIISKDINSCIIDLYKFISAVDPEFIADSLVGRQTYNSRRTQTKKTYSTRNSSKRNSSKTKTSYSTRNSSKRNSSKTNASKSMKMTSKRR